MDMQRHLLLVLLIVGVALLLLLAAGCVSEDVVYVDERGNELAVDGDGQPLFPPATTGAIEEAPYAESWDEPAEAPPPRVTTWTPTSESPGVGLLPPARAPGPTSAPSEDLPPAGPVATPLDGPAPAAARTGTRLPAVRAPAVRKVPVEPEPAKKAPAKKIDSSSGLDLPPAG